MEPLNQSAFLKALGWSLINSFWQFALLWLMFILITSSRKSLSASVKHAIALSLLVTGFIWFAGGLSYRYFGYSQIEGFHFDASLLNKAISGSDLYKQLSVLLESNLYYLSALYLIIVSALFVKFFRYFFYSHKIQTQGLIKIKAELRMYVEQLTLKLDIKKKVNVWLSEYVNTPIIVGFLKPTILIPLACMNQLSMQQLEAVLLHELAHVRRNDYLLNLFIAITEILFFFNPFARLFTRTIQQERENSCDDWVLQFKFDRYHYASALLSLEKTRASYLPLTLAATGEHGNKPLLRRIKRIMQVNVENRISGMRLFAYFLSIALLSSVALFNPGNIVIRNLAKEFPDVQPVLFASSETSVTVGIEPPSAKPVVIQQKKLLKSKEQKPAEHLAYEDAGVSEMLMINVADLALEGFSNSTRFIDAVKKETIEFSKSDNLLPVLPEEAIEHALPFVPRSSFSFVLIDTSKPKVKGESYYEKNARESLVKAKKAVQQIDWKRIEKQLNNNVDIVKLRSEIERSLEEVNWQQINEEVKTALSKENSERMSALKQEAEELNTYRTQQMYLQRLENELNLQRVLYKKDLEKQKAELRHQQIKKKPAKIIVYI